MFEEIHDTVSLRCVFCQSSNFKLPCAGHIPSPGEMLECENCGRESLYDAMLDVAQEEARVMVENALLEQLKEAGFKVK